MTNLLTEQEKDLILYGMSFTEKSTGKRIDPKTVRMIKGGSYYIPLNLDGKDVDMCQLSADDIIVNKLIS